MLTKDDLKKKTEQALKAAEILMENDIPDIAIYLMGYALEYTLKAAVCECLNVNEYPESSESGGKALKTHDFDTLLLFAGFRERFNISTAPQELVENWSETLSWTPELRYNPVNDKTLKDAGRMLSAMVDFPYGVITFIWRENGW